MKRILSLLLSVMLVLSAFPGVVFAAETAAVTVADAKGAVGETISLQVKLNTSNPVDSIALRNLVYNNEVLEFVGFDDYSALEDNFAFDATVEKDLTYISIALKEKVKFDATNENLCTLKFKVLKEEEASVSLTAIVKDDKVELVSTVVPGKVNELEKIASVTVADGTAKVGETLTLPVKLNTTTAVDSIALRDFSYDAEILEFTGFADYSALENLKALDFTMQNDPIYASFALKEAIVFDSSNENIVSLKFKALKAGNATVSFNAVVKNDAEVIDAVVDAGDVVVSDPTVEVTSVEFDVTEKELTEGDSFTLNATVLPGDATVKTLTWDSDAKAVATVDQTGKVTAIGAGTAKITATSTNGKSAECTVTVIAKPVPKSATFTLADADVKVGDTVTIPVKLNTTTAVDSIALRNFEYNKDVLKFTGFADYSALEALKALDFTFETDPAYASFGLSTPVVFDSSNENIVSLTFEAIKEGTSQVSFTAVVKNDAEVIDTVVNDAEVTVEKAAPTVIPVTSVTINKESAELTEGDKIMLEATVEPDDATDKTVTWSSDKESVATVVNGEVTAVAPGTATITAKAGDCEDTCVITVVAKPVIIPDEASFVIEGGNVKAGENIKVPVKLTTSKEVDSIAIRSLVYESEVLEFVGFADYEELSNNSAWDVTVENDKEFLSTALSAARKFDGEKIVAIEFKALKEGTSDVSFTAVVKNDTVEFDEAVNTASVTVEPKPVTGTAAFALSNEQIRVGETAKVKVELNTTAAVDSITIKNLDYDETEVEFIGFGDYNGLDNWTITPGTETVTLTAPLNTAKKFVFEKILTLEFKALKKGLALINFDAVVKNGTSEFKVTDNADGSINVLPAIVRVTEVIIENKPAKVTEGESFTLTATVKPDDATDKTVTWKSSDETVAKVDKDGNVTTFKAGKATITVETVDGGFKAECVVTVEPRVINVTGVNLDKTSNEVTEGDVFKLTATVTPDNASNKEVTWSSSDEAVAKVDKNGNVTTFKAGKATITVETVDGGFKAKCELTVKAKVIEVTGVTLSETAKTVVEGESFKLTATVKPDNATNKTVTWKSSDETVAKVDKDGNVTTLSSGSATITATAGTHKAECVVTVEPRVINVTEVKLDKTSNEVTEGDVFKLTATVEPDNASNKEVTWSSSDEAVAKVDKDGNVTTFKAGKATITVETVDGGFKAECEVTVKAKAISVTGVTLDEAAKTLTVGEEFTLTATVAPDNADIKTVTWSSSDETVAKVEDGKVTALKAGEATITVKTVDGGFTAECVVTVNAKALTGSVELTIVDDAIVCSDAFGEAVKGEDYEIKWFRNGEEITVEDGKYNITEEDYGATFSVKATANGTTYTGEFTDELVVPAKAPSDVKISTSKTEDSITAIFTAKANGSAITKFVVTITDNEAYSDAVEVTENDGKFRYTFENLETGVEYTITAKAVNGVGESEIATAKATPKKKTSSGGGTYPQIIRPANGTTPPAEDPVHRVEIDEDKKASIPGEDLKNKEKVEITFNDIPELPETKVEADIKDKDIANMEVIVEPTEDGDIKVEVVAKDSKGNEVELPVDIKIVSTEDKDAVIVDENGEEKALVTIYDAENGILEIKDVVSGNIKFAKEAKDWFDDDNGRWSESEINKAATRGLVNGKAPRIFEPTGNLTRHESNKLQMNLVNALDENLERTVFAKFDTPADHWAYASDDWAVSTGIMKGVGVLEDGTFVLNGEANITRQEFMTVIYRMMKAVLGDFEHDTVMADFVDSAEVADYAKDAVSFLSALNIVKGCEDCEELKINPTASITREEATAIINRVFDVVAALK